MGNRGSVLVGTTAAGTDGRALDPVETDVLIDLQQLMIVQLHPSLAELIEAWLDVNVTIRHLQIMVIRYNDGSQRRTNLPSRFNVTTPTMSGILDRLVRRDEVSRQDDPRIGAWCSNALTEQGQGLIDHLGRVQTDRLGEIVDHVWGVNDKTSRVG